MAARLGLLLLIIGVGVVAAPAKRAAIGELKNGAIAPGVFEAEGYVVHLITCPPCAQPGTCAPCPPDSFVLSEQPRYSGNAKLEDHEIAIIMAKPRSLAEGKKYRITLEMKLVPQRVSRTIWRSFVLKDAKMLP